MGWLLAICRSHSDRLGFLHLFYVPTGPNVRRLPLSERRLRRPAFRCNTFSVRFHCGRERGRPASQRASAPDEKSWRQSELKSSSEVFFRGSGATFYSLINRRAGQKSELLGLTEVLKSGG